MPDQDQRNQNAQPGGGQGGQQGGQVVARAVSSLMGGLVDRTMDFFAPDARRHHVLSLTELAATVKKAGRKGTAKTVGAGIWIGAGDVHVLSHYLPNPAELRVPTIHSRQAAAQEERSSGKSQNLGRQKLFRHGTSVP